MIAMVNYICYFGLKCSEKNLINMANNKRTSDNPSPCIFPAELIIPILTEAKIIKASETILLKT